MRAVAECIAMTVTGFWGIGSWSESVFAEGVEHFMMPRVLRKTGRI